METNKEQQHTPEPWKDGTHRLDSFLERINGDTEDYCLLSKEDYEHAKECVNAMEGIEYPQGWVKERKEEKELIDKMLSEYQELQKYKTACEGINPDNPMAVAENMKDVELLLKCIDDTNGEDIPLWIYKMGTELLTKIQSK